MASQWPPEQQQPQPPPGAWQQPAPPQAPPPSAYPPPSYAPPQFVHNTNVIVQPRSGSPSILIRAIWFLFIGWWLSWWVAALAYLMCVTIIGLPIGFALFNQLPWVLTLRGRTETYSTDVRDGVTFVRGDTQAQLPMLVRALWFVFVGWWLGAIYLGIAWFLCVILITMPIGLLMFNRVGAVMTLLRY